MKQDTAYKSKSVTGHVFLVFFSVLCLLFSPVSADENPLDKMRDETIAYFRPVVGTITSIEGQKAVINIGLKDAVKAGMRFNIFREEAPFRHPVTKEPLGRMEALIGKLDIQEVSADSSSGIILEGKVQEGDKVRISEMKVNILFCQSKETDWNLSEAYYNALKQSGRFHIIDTGIDTDLPSKIIEEAKRLRADVALLVTSGKTDSGMRLSQKLFWVTDGLQFSEISTELSPAFMKEARFGEEFLNLKMQDASLELDVPVAASMMVPADVEGDGKQEIVFSTGREIRVYTIGADLQPALGGVKIAGPHWDDFIWLDAIDLNGNGRDELIITTISKAEIGDPAQPTATGGNRTVTSYIYELQGTEFILLHSEAVFLRALDNKLIAQSYSRTNGFDGEVFAMTWDGAYKKGAALKLPRGVNIYDFVLLQNAGTDNRVLAYDESGFLNAYDSNGMKIWQSKTGAGGFLKTFRKSGPATMIDRGNWSVKDRLLMRDKNIFTVKRNPFIELMKGLGYKNSQIQTVTWDGLSVNESTFIDKVSGTIYDYGISGNRFIILATPPLGIRPGNILKGENPVRTGLYIYNMTGM